LPRGRQGGYDARLVRVLLVALLVHGLAPGLAEVGEAVVHWAQTGHAAHTIAHETDLGDQGEEHGCGTTQHRCACCATQVVAPADGGAVAVLAPALARALAPREVALAPREPARPFRPPIS
jgi:hypothetical protein